MLYLLNETKEHLFTFLKDDDSTDLAITKNKKIIRPDPNNKDVQKETWKHVSINISKESGFIKESIETILNDSSSVNMSGSLNTIIPDKTYVRIDRNSLKPFIEPLHDKNLYEIESNVLILVLNIRNSRIIEKTGNCRILNSYILGGECALVLEFAEHCNSLNLIIYNSKEHINYTYNFKLIQGELFVNNTCEPASIEKIEEHLPTVSLMSGLRISAYTLLPDKVFVQEKDMENAKDVLYNIFDGKFPDVNLVKDSSISDITTRIQTAVYDENHAIGVYINKPFNMDDEEVDVYYATIKYKLLKYPSIYHIISLYSDGVAKKESIKRRKGKRINEPIEHK